MKVNANIWLISIVFLLILSSCNSRSTKKTIENDCSNLPLKSANELAENLSESFKNEYSTSSSLLYSDYYGGSYITEGNQFVVFVFGDTISAKKDLLIRCKGAGFIIKPTEYSFNKLNDLVNELTAYLRNANNSATIQDLKFHGVGINKNRVSILLGDISSENIYKFKKEVIDSPIFIFEEFSSFRFDEEVIKK